MKSLEKRRMKVSTGALPSEKIEKLAFQHPLAQQVDVVFPEDQILQSLLSKLETSYVRGTSTLGDVLRAADSFVGSGGYESDILMFTPTTSGSSPDVWCIDPRGVLTLCVSKETYEALGIVGKPLPFKGHSDQHVIQISLRKNPDSTKVKAKLKASLEAWDQRRAVQEALEGWEVAYCSRDPDTVPNFQAIKNPQVCQVTCEQQELANVHIPIPALEPRPPVNGKRPSEELDDWTRDVMDFFEWAGLAALGSPRISIQDRVDPFVAVYEPPQPSRVGNVTRLCWRGLLGPKFVQSVLNHVSSSLQTSPLDDQRPRFAVITIHCVPTTPVSYFSSPSDEGGNSLEPSLRLPRQDAEDTLALLLRASPSGATSWTMIESIGQWDTRWG